MSVVNSYVLDVDLKRSMTSRTPTFKKGDNTILYFKTFDDGREYNIDDVDRAILNIESPSGRLTKTTATFTQIDGNRAVECFIPSVHTLESGIYKFQLSLISKSETISFQPFPVVVYDLEDVGCGNGNTDNIIDLIDDLNRQINDLILDLSDVIKQSEKGIPNGVPPLDKDGKIPPKYLPDTFDDMLIHVDHTVYKNQVHGMRILPERDYILEFNTDGNNWQYVNFAKDAGCGGTAQLLEVQITKSNGIATLTYTGTPTLTLQKWDYGERDKTYFSLQGHTFTSNKITLDRVGLYTLYYKDSNGLEYTRIFNVEQSDLPRPEVIVSIQNGNVEVEISEQTVLKKWAKGRRDVPYFQSQGNVFTGDTFTVDEVGEYTIYYKTTNGAEYVYVFSVNANDLALLDIVLTKSNGVVTITNQSLYTMTLKKWATGLREVSYFKSNGNVITGNTFEVTQVGWYTVYIKFSNGQEKVYNINIEESDLPKPSVNVNIQNGIVQVDISAPTTLKKWDSGRRNVAHFQSNGTAFTGNLFTVTSTGEYTIYYKLTNGAEYVYTFNVISDDLPYNAISLDVLPVAEGISVTILNGSNYDIVTKKWDYGIRNVDYFQSNGNIINGDNFIVTDDGYYSVYVRFSNGKEESWYAEFFK